jgi:6-phosphogluconolactonase (cycloisomerase 2 family)
VAAFARRDDGSLTPVAGSPFSAGGAGTGAGLASQGAIQVTSDGRFVIAVDAGSNQISVLRIERDGELEPVRDGVVSSGGVEPVSVGEHDGLVYVANAGAGGANYTGFRLSDGGRLRPLVGSTVPLPDSAQPGDVLFDSTGTKLIGTRIGTSQIDSFRVGFDGRLTAAAGSPFPAQGAGPFGSEFRPTNPSQLFVSNAHDGAGNGTVSAFNVGRDGTLSSIGASPFADAQTAPCWVEITHDGEFLFTVNTGSGSISRYSIAADGALRLLGSTPVSPQAGVGAVDARLSADGESLYVDESRVGAIGVFGVDGGSLAERGTVALPAGAAPAGVAVR